MKRTAKRGLSPIIATALLISLVVILSTVIFLWAKSYFGEQITKFDSPIEDSCMSVGFTATYSEGMLTITNNGNVPIYGVKIIEQGIFGTNDKGEYSGIQYVVFKGKTKSFDVSASNIVDTKNIVVVPILLGNIEGSEEKKAFACDPDYGRSLE